MSCLCCGKDTLNPKFCSSACAAKVNNRVPKRKRINRCRTCDVPIWSDRKYCPDHLYGEAAADLTLKQAKDRYGHLHTSSAYALVRSRARASVLDRPHSCIVCGYNNHVEVCHIKAISSYPEDTLVSIVNAPDNLIILCPNHHWELDHGLWSP